MKAHAAVAAELLGDAACVEAAVRDVASSPLSAAEKALLAFVERVNADAASIGPADIAGLHASGWTEEAVYDAITVCALLNFYNRWVDATGVPPMSDEENRAAARRMAPGYIRTAPQP